MLFVLILMGVLWAVGAAMKAPVRARLVMIAVLYAGVLVIQLTLPAGSELRVATGESPAPWLMLGVAVALFWGYRRLLLGLRSRAAARAPAAEPTAPAAFREVELERYARHIMLREIGGTGQRRLLDARVLVIGAGGLGSPALLYLGAAGVGTLGIIDHDRVENSNLQRQILHADARIGMPKVFSAQAAVEALNPFVTVRPYNRHLTEDIAEELFGDYDLILDGSDNFDTRELANRAAVATGKPLVSAAIAQWEGQIGVYHPATGGPCLACVFPERPAPGLAPSCAEAGVAAPLPGVIGSMMAAEAMKLLTGAGAPLLGRLLIFDALEAESRTIRTRPAPACRVCGGGAIVPAAAAG